MCTQANIDIRTDQPWPYRSLMTCSIALQGRTIEMLAICWIGGTERTQSHRRQQMVRYLLQHRGCLLLGKQVTGQRSCKQLIRAQRSIILTCNPIYIDNIVEIATCLIPETSCEVLTHLSTQLAVPCGIDRETHGPGLHRSQVLIPERVYLH